MARANFSKVEDSLKQGLEEFGIEKLLEVTDKESDRIEQERRSGQLAILIQYELKSLYRHGFNLYTLLHIDKKELKKFINNPSLMTKDDKEKLIDIKKKIDVFREEKKDELRSDEDVVTEERYRHKHKKINVRENWLPLK